MMSEKTRKVIIILLAVITAVTLILAYSLPSYGSDGINPRINFQGRLLTPSGAPVADGTYNMEFKIYRDGDGNPGGGDEALLWTETRTGGARVGVTNGHFSILLGEVTGFGSSVDWNHSVLWLSVNVGGTGGTPSWDGEMSPLKRLASVPQAFNADMVDGAHAGTGANNVLKLDGSGNVNIAGGLIAGGNLDVDGTVLFQNAVNSTTAVRVVSSAGSILFDADTTNLRIGIRTTVPLANLHVSGDGTFRIQDTGAPNAWEFNARGSGALDLNDTVAGLRFSIDSSGNVIIPTLGAAGGTAVCRNASNQIATCSAGGSTATLQSAYDNGNAVTTTDNRNILFTLDNTTTDSDFIVDLLGAGNTIEFRDGGTAFATFSDTGTTLFRPTSNSTTAFQVQNAAGTTTVLDIDTTNGRVGIGTSSPEQTLSVAGDIQARRVADADAGNTTRNSNLIRLQGAYWTGAASSNINFRLRNIVSSTVPNYRLAFEDDSGNERMVITNTGNVGINTTGPDRLLDILSTSNPQLRLTHTDSSVYTDFQTTSSGYLSIDPSGDRVGINNSTPSQALDVVGNIANLQNSAAPPTSVSTFSLLPASDGPEYVFVSGRYAYVVNGTDSDTFQVIDVTNPSSPASVGSLAVGTDPESLYVAGRYAYIVYEHSLQIIDISNPASPTSAGTLSLGAGAFPEQIQVIGRYAYVINLGPDTFQVINVTNPAAPTSVTTLALAAGADPEYFYILDRYAYVANKGTDTLQIIDISNPSAPSSVSTLSLAAGADIEGLFVSGRYAYIVNPGTETFQVVDVSNPSSASIIATITYGAGANPESVAVAGRYAYVVTEGTDTFRVIDVANPSSPTEISSLALAAGADPEQIYIDGRYAYIVNKGTDTLQIIDLRGIETTAILAHSAETGYLSVTTHAQIDNTLEVGNGLNVGVGGIFSAGQLGVNNDASVIGTVAVGTLGTSGTAALCRNASNQLASCNAGVSAATLQSAYEAGNTITTTEADGDILFTLADTTSDQDFIVNMQGTGNIFEVRDSGTAIATFADEGVITLQNRSASSSAFNMTSTGDFEFRDAGSTFLTISDTGGFDLTLDGTDNPAFLITNAGTTDMNINLTSTGDFGILVSGANIAEFNGSTGVIEFFDDIDVALAGTENLSITNTVSGTSALDLISTVLTNNTTSGTQRVALLQNAAGTGTTETLLTLDNADTDTAVTDGLVISSAAGAITDAIDLTDTDIVNALNIGDNILLGTTPTINFTNFDLTGTADTTWVLGATDNLLVDATTNDTTLTTGVVDIDADSSTNNSETLNVNLHAVGSTVGATQQVVEISAWQDPTTNPRTVSGISIDFVDTGSLANTTRGILIDTNTVNTADTVTGIEIRNPGTTTTTAGLHIQGSSTGAYTDAILIQNTSSGAITTALNVSDAEIATALAIGANDISTSAGNGLTVNCAASEFLQDPQSQAGIVVAGTCATPAGTATLQSVYDNSSSPATIDMTSGKNIVFDTTDEATDPNIIFNLSCATCSAGGGHFLIQDAGTTFASFKNDSSILFQSNASSLLRAADLLGNTLFVVDATNDRVGVDISSPLAVLHVSQDNTDPLFRVTDATATAVDVLNIADEGAITFKNRTNSTTAFQVQPSGSTTPILNVDTTTDAVSIGTATIDSGAALEVLDAAGDAILIKTANTNASTLDFGFDTVSSRMRIASNVLGTGTFRDLSILVGSGGERIRIDTSGNITMGLNVTSGTTTTDFGGTTTLNALCHATLTGTNDEEIRDCSGAPSDIAEWYETKIGVEPGDVVVPTDESLTYTEILFDPRTGTQNGRTATHTLPVLGQSSTPYNNKVLGVVSTSPYQVYGEAVLESATRNPRPVALAGRVPVKVSTENGPIAVGDVLTASSTPGHAMKATQPGRVIGVALQPLNGSSGQILVLVNPHWWHPDAALQGTADSEQLTVNELTVEKLIVREAATFEKDLVVKGDLVIKGLIKASDKTRGSVPVPVGATSLQLFWSRSVPPTALTTTPTWNTTTWVTNLSATGATIRFGTPPPPDQSVYWIALD